jgi:hypothetical protein
MRWVSFDGLATPEQLVLINRILSGWEREKRLPEFLQELLVENFIAELRDAKAWLEKELAQKN